MSTDTNKQESHVAVNGWIVFVAVEDEWYVARSREEAFGAWFREVGEDCVEDGIEAVRPLTDREMNQLSYSDESSMVASKARKISFMQRLHEMVADGLALPGSFASANY